MKCLKPERETGDWCFEVGEDRVTSESEGATEWSPTFDVNLKIVGGEMMFSLMASFH